MIYRSFLVVKVCLVAILFHSSLLAQEGVNHELIAYQGYRIELLFPANGIQGTNFTSTIVNSGKYPVTLGLKNEAYENLQVLVEDNPAFAENPGLKKDLIKTALRQKIVLSPGQSQKNVFLQTGFSNVNISPEAEFSIPENISLENSDKKAKKQKEKVEKKRKAKAAKIKKQKNDERDKEKTEPIIYKMPESDVFDSVNCADLMISEAAIIKQSKHKLKLECTIQNAGRIPAALHHFKKTEQQDISLAAYFSASGKMSRGSVLAGGYVIKDGLDKTSGLLLPGESMKVKFDVSLENSSRYLNSLIISVDSRQLIYECIENNNTFVIQLRK